MDSSVFRRVSPHHTAVTRQGDLPAGRNAVSPIDLSRCITGEAIAKQVTFGDLPMQRTASVTAVSYKPSLLSPSGGYPSEVRRATSGLAPSNAPGTVRDMESLIADLRAAGSATVAPATGPRGSGSAAVAPAAGQTMQRAISAAAVAVNGTLTAPRTPLATNPTLTMQSSARHLHASGSSQVQLSTPRRLPTSVEADVILPERSISRGVSKSVSCLPTYSGRVTGASTATTALATPRAGSSFLSPRTSAMDVRSYPQLNAAAMSPPSMFRPVSGNLITPRGMPGARVG